MNHPDFPTNFQVQRPIRAQIMKIANHVAPAIANNQPGSLWMGTCQPALAHMGKALRLPVFSPLLKPGGQQFQKITGHNFNTHIGKRRHRSIRQLRRMCQIDPNPQNQMRPFKLQQDAGKLDAIKKQVIGPFQHQSAGANQLLAAVKQRQCHHKAQLASRPSQLIQTQQAGRRQIAFRHLPGAATPAATARLVICIDPLPIGQTGSMRLQPVIGRADLGKVDELAQNRLDAARRDAQRSGPNRR